MTAGYDMEDAMILNKSAVERGLGHATMLKTEQVDLTKESGDCPAPAPALALLLPLPLPLLLPLLLHPLMLT